MTCKGLPTHLLLSSRTTWMVCQCKQYIGKGRAYVDHSVVSDIIPLQWWFWTKCTFWTPQIIILLFELFEKWLALFFSHSGAGHVTAAAVRDAGRLIKTGAHTIRTWTLVRRTNVMLMGALDILGDRSRGLWPRANLRRAPPPVHLIRYHPSSPHENERCGMRSVDSMPYQRRTRSSSQNSSAFRARSCSLHSSTAG